MYLELFKVNVNDREDIRNGLISLCSNDSDMNGDNGEEFLWEEAEGYESNAEYLADSVMEENENVESMFENFMYEWMDRDCNYYDLGYEMDMMRIGDELIVSVAYGHNEF